jgi:hypothetical protein
MMLADRLGAQGDAFYAKLMEAHEGLTEQDSHRLNARLVLILANEIGDADRLAALIDAASETAIS